MTAPSVAQGCLSFCQSDPRCDTVWERVGTAVFFPPEVNAERQAGTFSEGKA